MANTRKPVKPKAGAEPASNEVISVGSGEGITVDEKSALYDGISSITGIPTEGVEHLFEEDDSNEDSPEITYTPTAEEVAAVLAFIRSQTVAETLLEEPAPVAKELFVKVYDVVDTITGNSIRPEDNGALTLSGRVTDADLDAAGVDKAWLLSIGAIVDAGYASGE